MQNTDEEAGLYELAPFFGEADCLGDERRIGILPPCDTDFLDDILPDAETADPVQLSAGEFFLREQRDAHSSLDHIQGIGGLAGTAHNVWFEAGVPARLEHQLRGDLPGLVKDKTLVFQFFDADLPARGKRMIKGKLPTRFSKQ